MASIHNQTANPGNILHVLTEVQKTIQALAGAAVHTEKKTEETAAEVRELRAEVERIKRHPSHIPTYVYISAAAAASSVAIAAVVNLYFLFFQEKSNNSNWL